MAGLASNQGLAAPYVINPADGNQEPYLSGLQAANSECTAKPVSADEGDRGFGLETVTYHCPNILHCTVFMLSACFSGTCMHMYNILSVILSCTGKMLQFLTSYGAVSRVVGPAALVPQYNYVQTQWGMYPQNAGLLQQTLPQAGQTTPQGQVLRGQTPRSLTPSQTEGLGTPTGSVQSQLHTPGACVNR